MTLDALAAALTTDLERIFGLFRSLSPPSGLSMTAGRHAGRASSASARSG